MKSREELVNIYEKVIEELKDGYYTNNFGEEIPLSNTKIKSESVMISSEDLKNPVTSENYFENTKIYVQNIDSFLKAIEMGPKSLVLNMASARNPGGGVHKGSRAQEEDLCRRSNLLLSLYSFSYKGKELNLKLPKRDLNYPIPTYGGIYSPSVLIYRKKDYSVYDDTYKTNVVSVSALVNPEYDPKTLMINKSQIHIVRNKIKSILRIAILKGHTKLILGAFGCGAFSNPPKHVALLFKEVLELPEFKHAFEEICFAILDDGNTGKMHNPEGNYKPFLEVFGNVSSK